MAPEQHFLFIQLVNTCNIAWLLKLRGNTRAISGERVHRRNSTQKDHTTSYFFEPLES